MNEEHGPAQAGVIPVKGVTLSYRIEGSGSPCLVVASAVYHPRTFSARLREHLTLIFVDMRTFVPSDPAFDVAQVTRDTYLDDIEQVRRALGLDKVVVIGYSIAGPLVLEYARRFPQRVWGAVVIAGPPCGMGEVDWTAEQFWQADASAERKAVLQANAAKLTPEVLGSLDPGEAVTYEYVARSPMYSYNPHYDASWLWAGVYVNAPLFDHLFGTLFATYDLAQGPGHITVPVLLILGRHDYVVRTRSGKGGRRQCRTPPLTSSIGADIRPNLRSRSASIRCSWRGFIVSSHQRLDQKRVSMKSIVHAAREQHRKEHDGVQQRAFVCDG